MILPVPISLLSENHLKWISFCGKMYLFLEGLFTDELGNHI